MRFGYYNYDPLRCATPRNLRNSYQYFRGTCCPHFQDRRSTCNLWLTSLSCFIARWLLVRCASNFISSYNHSLKLLQYSRHLNCLQLSLCPHSAKNLSDETLNLLQINVCQYYKLRELCWLVHVLNCEFTLHLGKCFHYWKVFILNRTHLISILSD